MLFLNNIRHKIFKWFLYKVYSGSFFKEFNPLQPGSRGFEEQYEIDRYAIIEAIQPEDRMLFQKLMALNVNYLSRKSHESYDEKKNLFMKGRIMQASYEYALFDLVETVQKKETAKKIMRELDKKKSV